MLILWTYLCGPQIIQLLLCMRRYMNCFAIPYFILAVFDLVQPELTTCYLQNVIVEGLGVITQICYAKSNFMHLIRASTFALLDLELNRVMYLSKVYSENCIYVISVACLLLAQFMGVVWLLCISTAGICCISASSQVLFRRGRWIR